MSRAKNLANFQTTITDGTTSVATSFVTNGSAKAWARFDGSGTASIDDSFNTSSLTDNGTGKYALSWSSSFSASTYVTSGLCEAVSVGDSIVVCQRSTDVWTASSFGLSTVRGDNNFIDSTRIAVNAHGDLA